MPRAGQSRNMTSAGRLQYSTYIYIYIYIQRERYTVHCTLRRYIYTVYVVRYVYIYIYIYIYSTAHYTYICRIYRWLRWAPDTADLLGVHQQLQAAEFAVRVVDGSEHSVHIIYIYIYVITYIHMYECMYVYIYILFMYIYIYICIHIHTIYTYIYIYIYTFLSTASTAPCRASMGPLKMTIRSSGHCGAWSWVFIKRGVQWEGGAVDGGSVIQQNSL